MKRTLFALIGLFLGAQSALALHDPQDCSVPAGSIGNTATTGNTGFSLPITNQITTYSCGPGTGGIGNSPAGSCSALIAANGFGTSVCSCEGSGSNGTCHTTVSGGSCGSAATYSWAVSSSSGCPSGYALSGSTCVSNTSTNENSAAATQGLTYNRDADGNIQSESGGLNSWTVTARDSIERPTNVTAPDSSAVTYTYYPNSIDVQTRTDANGTVTYTWLDHARASAITLPDGTVYDFTYGTTTDSIKYLAGVGVTHGVQHGARAGTPAPYGVAIPFVTSQADGDRETVAQLDPPFVGPDPFGTFKVANSTALEGAIDNPAFPDINPTLPAPSSDACAVVAAADVNVIACSHLANQLYNACQRIYGPWASGTNAFYNTCVARIPIILAGYGCAPFKY